MKKLFIVTLKHYIFNWDLLLFLGTYYQLVAERHLNPLHLTIEPNHRAKSGQHH